ncbi:MAG: hypothetical protein KAU38_07585 [Desulfobacterales bacterium]|nr:hypothetical protein [Desulfobacterales bacterium]
MIVGAWFKQPLNLSNAILAHQLALLDSIFDSDVNLSFLKTPHSINMRGSKFNGKLAMIDLEVESNLCMGDGAEFADEIFLTAAKIGGGC